MVRDAAPVDAPFRLPGAVRAALPRFGGDLLCRAFERLLAFPELNAVYRRVRQMAGGHDADRFCELALQALDIRIDVSDDDLRRVPTAGPLIVVANHPLGGLDGMALAALLLRVRPDVRLLANFFLGAIPEMAERCFLVDPFGGRDAPHRNRAATAAALRWVRRGGALGVFPAGEVAHFTLRRGCVTDPPWNAFVGRLVQHTQAAVLPVFFAGRNSVLFQAAGLVHPRFRTVLLPRELLARRGGAVRVEVASPLPYARLSRLFDCGLPRARGDLAATRPAAASRESPPASGARDPHGDLTEYLRVRTFVLRGRGPRDGRARAAATVGGAVIVAPVPADALAAEIAGLPRGSALAESGDLAVYCAAAAAIPLTLREIGRLREVTFRTVGEGTGREIDLDRFDPHYLHLFVWDGRERLLVGAYRMGPTDELLRRFGPAGLYTSTLFDFQPELLAQIDPALELGRSFVVPEFQRDYAPLMLLWKGIGRYVAGQPRYRRLLGPVSISDDFQSMTKQLLMAFLKANKYDARLAPLVHPKHPPRVRPFRDADAGRVAAVVRDMSEVEDLVAEIESHRRGVPVLLRQYLKLNAKLLGFNIDPDFGDVLDGLILIDLASVDRAVLNRYLGREGAEAFLSLHADAGAVSGALR